MTSLLLDTHALLWLLMEPQRIPAATLARIRDSATKVTVSTVSAWEIGTKFRLGKLDEAAAVVHGYADHLARIRAFELPVSSHHALTAGTLNWDHRDPFDRMIAAQAMVESIPLVTTDQAFTSLPGVTTIW